MCPRNCHLNTDPYHVVPESIWFLEGGRCRWHLGRGHTLTAVLESCWASLSYVQTSVQISVGFISPERRFISPERRFKTST